VLKQALRHEDFWVTGGMRNCMQSEPRH